MTRFKIVLQLDAEALRTPASRPERPVWAERNLMEAAVFSALARRGHEVTVIAVNDPVRDLVAQLSQQAPDLIFNFALHYRGDRRKATHIAAMLDWLGIPYTGAGPHGILRASDKVLSKQLVRLLGVRTPRTIAVPPGQQLPDHDLAFPIIVKPRFEGGSAGIGPASVTRDQAALRRRVNWLHRNYHQDAVCEEFIAGREVSIGLIGNSEIHAFPIRERLFPPGSAQIATLQIKHDQYRTKSSRHWQPIHISARARRRIEDEAKRIYAELQLRDFARLDYRLKPSGEFYFLEANHCPDCAPHSFGVFAAWRSIDFPNLLDLIIAECLERFRRSPVGLKRPVAARLRQLNASLGDVRAQIQ
jgi:D-alanine-D-alanine ligase